MKTQAGKIVLFGSGETSPTGRAIHRKVFLSGDKKKYKIAILETPAGFQPNSAYVANEIAKIFRDSLAEFVSDITVIPARKTGTSLSPDNAEILEPLTLADYIFLGPGSPTYALHQLKDSLAWQMIVDRWKQGATLSFSSAAVLAIGIHTLPVYEIYKAGFDLYWEEGLNLLGEIGLAVTVIGHWNNQEGGKDLDTSRCFMGLERFEKLRALLPLDEIFLGIDEQTAIILDPKNDSFIVEGKGAATVLVHDREQQFSPGSTYDLESLHQARVIEASKNLIEGSDLSARSDPSLDISSLPADIQLLVKERRQARASGNFPESDRLRKNLLELGYEVRDTEKGQMIFPFLG